MTKKKTSVTHRVLTIVGTVLCIILIPILLINITLIAKSYINKDEVPSIGGTFPLIVLTDSMVPEIYSGDLIICKTADAEDIALHIGHDSMRLAATLIKSQYVFHSHSPLHYFITA